MTVNSPAQSGILRADISRYKIMPPAHYNRGLVMKARIREDLKAGGNIPKHFVVEMTPQGIRVDVTV